MFPAEVTFPVFFVFMVVVLILAALLSGKV